MNLVDAMIVERVDEIFIKMEELSIEIIAIGQAKSNSTSIMDLTTKNDIDSDLAKEMAVLQIQLNLLRSLSGE